VVSGVLRDRKEFVIINSTLLFFFFFYFFVGRLHLPCGIFDSPSLFPYQQHNIHSVGAELISEKNVRMMKYIFLFDDNV
jgi:hypothetical protein